MDDVQKEGVWVPQLPDLKVWEIPKILEQGDPNEEALFLEVGRTLSAWEGLEWMLSTLYSELLGSHSYAAARSYGLVTTASIRSSMLAEVLDISRHEEQIKNWSRLEDASSLLKHYGKASAIRNHIAHGMVVGVTSGAAKPTFYIAPAGYITKRNSSRFALSNRPKNESTKIGIEDFGFNYAYTSDQIRSFRGNVEELSMFCSSLVDSLRQHWFERKAAGQPVGAGGILVVKSS